MIDRRSSQWTTKSRRGFRPNLEILETRETPATVSGNVFQTLEIAGLFPQPSGSFLQQLTGVTVNLDDDGVGPPLQSTTTAAGAYSFAGVAPGSYTVSLELPPAFANLIATSSLEYTINVTANNFPNLNFALMDKTDGLISNLFEMILSRSADLDTFNQKVQDLGNGVSVGKVFQSLYKSTEFTSLSQPVANFLGAMFSGPLDVGQFRNAVQLQNLGTSQDAVILQILYSQKFVDAYGDTSLLSNTDYVNFLYQELLNKNPTAKQRAKWVDQLDAGEANRGDVAIALVTSNAFSKNRGNIIRRTGISLAYLGVLGQEVTDTQLSNRLKQMRNGKNLRTIVNQLANGATFQDLTAFTDTLVWDAMTHQIKPAVSLLDRLAKYNPVTQQFDIAVTAGSITGTDANAYFLAHGWAPGFTEDVLLNSTPGNPVKWWQTNDSVWLENGVNRISSEGLAQAIIDRDPNAQVFAFSWIDQSNTPASTTTTSFTLPGNTTAGSAIVTGVDTTTLVAGMTVTGPGIPLEAVIVSIDSATQVTLSAAALGTAANPLTYSTTNLTIVNETGDLNSTTTISNLDTSKLSVGMQVAGAGITIGTTIASIVSGSSITLSATATATATGVNLTFKGTNLGQELGEYIYAGQSESYTQLNGYRLATAISLALSGTFETNGGLLHLLGHSHGSKVVTVAALALQQLNLPIAHLTTLESPEAGPVLDVSGINVYSHLSAFGGAQNFLWYYMAQMDISRSPVAGRAWNDSTFIDNYFSNEGFGAPLGAFNTNPAYGTGDLSQIVDFKFYAEHLYGPLSTSNPFGALDTLFGSHGYPPPWYAQASLTTTEWGLNLSPLINDAAAAALADSLYQQNPTATTPGQYVINQFDLTGTTRATITPSTPTALEYAQQYTVGSVVDNGTSIALTVDAGSSLAMDVITFNPIGIGSLNLGAGMDFQFEFTGLQPGEQVELQVWIHGLAGVPVLEGVLGSTLGELSIPLFTMNAGDAPLAPQTATVSLGGFFSETLFGKTLTGPFNAVNNGSASTIVPTIGFTLVGNVSGPVTATVSNLRQFNDGATTA